MSHKEDWSFDPPVNLYTGVIKSVGGIEICRDRSTAGVLEDDLGDFACSLRFRGCVSTPVTPNCTLQFFAVGNL